ncbi:pectin methylesterase [Zopfochytrium polystomum]|nr:pectin methylesterase [Zopfochytrium polystomum]
MIITTSSAAAAAAAVAAAALALLAPASARNINADYCKHAQTACIVVGPTQKYTTIQSAVASLDDTTPYTIVVQSGVYHEQVNVTRTGPLTLRGETTQSEDIAFNTVNITWSAAAGTGNNLTDNAYSSVLTVAPNLNASLTGSGPTGFPVLPNNPFGNVDFRAHNINFENKFSDHSSGPALALSVGYSNSSFYRCGFYSFQDTLYVGKLANAYFKENIIAGQTDFFYGFGTAWVENSTVVLRNCGGGITAWKGTNTTFTNKYGVYIHNSAVVRANSSLAITGNAILPAGYIKWSATDNRINNQTFMAEYSTYGPGFNATARAANAGIGMVLTHAEYSPYSSPDRVFQFPFTSVEGNTAWLSGDR